MNGSGKKWKDFATDIEKWLKQSYSLRFHFKNSHQSIVGFPSDGFRSDGMLTDGKTLLAVEIESRQTHPDTNTGKYWFLYKRYNKYSRYQRIILFHVFTPLFDSYGWRKELAAFYVAKMRKEIPIEYILKEFKNDTDYSDALSELKNAIQSKIMAEFIE